MSDSSYFAVQELLAGEFDLSLGTDAGDFLHRLAAKINELIQKDFTSLVNILYRIDVDESKLRQSLDANPGENAGYIIAKLIIERQLQKIKTRQKFRNDSGIDEEERW